MGGERRGHPNGPIPVTLRLPSPCGSAPSLPLWLCAFPPVPLGAAWSHAKRCLPQLDLGRKLGEGSFGEVLLGNFRGGWGAQCLG